MAPTAQTASHRPGECQSKENELSAAEGSLKNISEKFLGAVNVYAMVDSGGILSEHESPSDNDEKWEELKSCLVKIR